MPTELPQREPTGILGRRSSRPAGGNWALASLSVPVLFVALTAALPGPLALPAFGFITFGIGMLVAMCAYLRQVVPAAARERLLDVAGMLVLIGSVAFIMTDKAGAFAELGMNYVGSGQNAK